jgi:cytochrome c553
MRTHLKIVAVLAAALLSAAVSAENKYDYCLLCHGSNANGNYGIRAPKLSGMEPWYLTRQLENFAAGIRGAPEQDFSGHEMRVVGIRLEQEKVLQDAVKFIVALESKKPLATVSGNVKAGKEIYETCVACHGAKGEGSAALQSPALASRSDWYLVTQLKNFRLGLRGTDPRDTLGAQMQAIGATLPDDQAITDVVAYINTL